MDVENILRQIENEIQRCGTSADDGSRASGYQQGLKDGLRKAQSIIILDK